DGERDHLRPRRRVRHPPRSTLRRRELPPVRRRLAPLRRRTTPRDGGAAMRRLSLGGCALLGAIGLSASALAFDYHPPGDLVEGSGQGRVDDTVYAPGMRFPIENAPAYANSQVYNPGGYLGPAGGQCDAVNYSYPWRDNYCEIRQWDMP